MLHRGVRVRSEEQFVPDLESDVVGELFSASGAGGGDTEIARRRDQGARCAHGRGQSRPNGGSQTSGIRGGIDLPPGLLRLPAGPVATGRGRGLPDTLLEDRLGDRSGHPEVLRQRALGPPRQGGDGPRRPAVGGAVCDTVAESAVATTRRCLATTRPRDPTRIRGLTRAG